MKLHGKIKNTNMPLSNKGAKNDKEAFIAVTLANLVLMLPVGLLYAFLIYLLEESFQEISSGFCRGDGGSAFACCPYNVVSV